MTAILGGESREKVRVNNGLITGGKGEGGNDSLITKGKGEGK